MNPRFLIQVDNLAKPIAGLIEGFAGFLPAKLKRNEDPGGRVILFKFFGMGSIIRLTSILEKKNVDKSRIMLCTLDQNRALCEILGYKNVVLVRAGVLHGAWDLVRLISRIRKFRALALIDLERSSHLVSAFRLLASGISGLYCHGFDNRSATKQLPIGTIHSLNDTPVWQFVDSWFKKKDTAPFIPSNQVTINPRKIIVNLNASKYVIERRYPANQFKQVIELLHQWKPDLEFTFSGVQGEFDYIQDFVNSIGITGKLMNNCGGQWSLNELVDQLSTSGLFITNDSGPMHLAAYLGVPTIAIWGPTHYADFGYQQNNGLINLSLEKTCSPCFQSPKSAIGEACKGGIDCMVDLSPERIVKAAKQLLDDAETVRQVKHPSGLSPVILTEIDG